MLVSLWLPIVVSAVALFFASFLSWMVLQLHRSDWRKLPKEDEFLESARRCGIPGGNYMFPAPGAPAEAKGQSEIRKEATPKEAGPHGVMTVFDNVNMGANLGLTFLYFLAVSFLLAYLATMALERGADYLPVFRFVSTAALMTFLAAIVQHAIWFRCRIVGHVIESVAYAAIVGAIFAWLWPGS